MNGRHFPICQQCNTKRFLAFHTDLSAMQHQTLFGVLWKHICIWLCSRMPPLLQNAPQCPPR